MITSQDWTILARAALAGILGFVVGWERESHGHEAGIRTISLVTMGAAILTALAMETFPTPDRLIANIVTGVGFLGAGMILHAANIGKVRGLTTAASVWTLTSVGIVVGTGRYALGVMLTALVLLLLWWQYIPILSRANPKITRKRQKHLLDSRQPEIIDNDMTPA